MSRSSFVWITRVAITVLFVYIANRSLTEAQLGSIPGSIRPLHIALSFALGLAGLFCQIKRWQIILRYQKLPSTVYAASKTIFVGSLLAFVTPGRLGELLRGLPLSRERRGDTVFAVVIDKLFILLATFTVGIVCASGQVFALRIALSRRVVAMSGVAGAVCLVVAALLLYRRSLSETGGFGRFFVRLLNLSPKLLTRSGRNALGLSLAAHTFLVAQTVVLAKMFGCGGAVRIGAAIGQAYAFMTFMPVSIANIGIREYSFALFLDTIHAGCVSQAGLQSAALGTSIGILIMNLILPALVGLVWSVAGAARARA